MNSTSNSGEVFPNADVLRLREYAKVINNVSDLIEVFERTDTKMDIDNDYVIDVEKSPEIIIPQSVTRHIGEVSYITAKLKLVADTMHIDEEILLDNSDEALFETIFNQTVSPLSAEEEVVHQTSMTSMYFFGQHGVFSLQRSNIQNNDTLKDIVFVNSARNKEQEVEAVSEDELKLLMLSIINPNLIQNYADKPFDMTSPEVFEAINELLESRTRVGIHDKLHFLPFQDSTFRHRQEYDPKSQRARTSFSIKFRCNEPDNHLVIVTHNLDTEYKLHFEIVPQDYFSTRESLDQETPLSHPYTPSLDELTYLNDILRSEVIRIKSKTLREEVHIEDLEDVASHDAIDSTAIETDYRFEQIATNDDKNLRRAYNEFNDNALNIELDAIIREGQDDKED